MEAEKETEEQKQARELAEMLGEDGNSEAVEGGSVAEEFREPHPMLVQVMKQTVKTPFDILAVGTGVPELAIPDDEAVEAAKIYAMGVEHYWGYEEIPMWIMLLATTLGLIGSRVVIVKALQAQAENKTKTKADERPINVDNA